MWATRLSIRRAGPELTEEKKTSNGSGTPFSSSFDSLTLGAFNFPSGSKRETSGRPAGASTLPAVGLWYWLGLGLGLGVALGVAIGGLLAPVRGAVPLSALVAAGCGYAPAFFFLGHLTALTGTAGGALGGAAVAELARRTLSRGGTWGATTLLLLGAALVTAALAFVPAFGYVEIVLAGVLALMLLRGGGGRYAGLRILARD
jgi:hypothetical protein